MCGGFLSKTRMCFYFHAVEFLLLAQFSSHLPNCSFHPKKASAVRPTASSGASLCTFFPMEIYGRCGTSSWLVGPFWILFEAQKLIERQTLHPWRGKPKRGLNMSRSQQYWSTGLVWVWAWEAPKCKPQTSFNQELRQPVSKTGATPNQSELLKVLPADFPEMGEDYEAFRAIGVAGLPGSPENSVWVWCPKVASPNTKRNMTKVYQQRIAWDPLEMDMEQVAR